MSVEQLFAAIQSGNLEETEALVSADAELRRASDEQGVSLLMQALYHRQPDIARLLASDREDLSFQEAVALGQRERVTSLLQQDAGELSSRSPDGFTPLHYAAFFGREEIARLLLESGAEVNVAADNPTRVHPLHSAAAIGAHEICRQLLERGADANARQQLGFTALMSAAMLGNEELVRMLLDHGADPKLETEDGRTATSMAREGGHEGVLALLNRRGRPSEYRYRSRQSSGDTHRS